MALLVLLVVGADLRAALPADTHAQASCATCLDSLPLQQIKVGLVAPPTEPDSTSLIRGAKLAAAAAKAAGDVDVALDVRSEGGQWGSAGNDAVMLVNERHVDALVTPADGADSHLILQVSGRTRVPVLTVCPEMSVTRAGIPWTVRVVPGNDQQATALFAATRNADGSPTHWWAVVPSGRPGRAARHDLELSSHTAGATIDRFVEFDVKSPIEPTVKAIAAGAPAGVLLWVSPARAGALAADLRAAGYQGRLAGPATLDSPAFLAHAKAAANGMMIPTWKADTGSSIEAAEFKRMYQARYAADPDFAAAAAFDAVRVLIATLRDRKPGEGYRAFPVSAEIIGATGVMHFDSAGNRTDALQVVTIRDGKLSGR